MTPSRRRTTGVLSLFLFALVLGARADSPVEMLQGALDAYFDNRYEDSIQLFQLILKSDPKNAGAKKGLKNAEKKRGEQVRLQRDQERKALFVAQDYLAKGKGVEAYDRAQEILTRAPNLPDGVALLKKVRAKAEKDFQKAKPGSSAAHEAQGVLAYMDEDWFKAVDSWEKVLVFNKNRGDLVQKIALAKKRMLEQQRQERIRVNLDLAEALVQQGAYAEAIQRLSEVLQLDPTNAEARMALNSARRLSSIAKREAMDDRAQDLNQKAMNAFSAGRRKEALAIFNQVLEIDPQNMLANDYRERIVGLEPSLLDDPTASRGKSTDYDRALQALKNDHFVEGIEALNRYLQKSPNDVRAQQALEEARARQSEMTERVYREGLTAYSQGDREGSIRKLQQCLTWNPEFLKAKQALVKILQEGKQ